MLSQTSVFHPDTVSAPVFLPRSFGVLRPPACSQQPPRPDITAAACAGSSCRTCASLFVHQCKERFCESYWQDVPLSAVLHNRFPECRRVPAARAEVGHSRPAPCSTSAICLLVIEWLTAAHFSSLGIVSGPASDLEEGLAAHVSWRLGWRETLSSAASCCRRSFLTKLDIHGDTHPGLWELFNRMVDKLTPRKNERSNENDASSG